MPFVVPLAKDVQNQMLYSLPRGIVIKNNPPNNSIFLYFAICQYTLLACVFVGHLNEIVVRSNIIRNTALVAIAILALSFVVPKGWKKSGSAEQKYEMGVWKVGGHDSSKACGVIRASKEDYFGEDYGSLMQTISSQRYLGKRIRMTGYMKTKGVTMWAGFYVRVDKEDAKEPLSFDNMADRHIVGSTNWTQYKIEVDVPFNASKIAFGARLHGPGQIWFDDISFEEIGNSTIKAETVLCDTSLKRIPENLDFEQ